MIEYQDFVGFTFNDKHSSELGIIRTSDGSRYNYNLLPTAQDKTVQVPGGDGTYFFGSQYTQRPLPVKIAFDNLSEEKFVELMNHFGDKQLHELWFDEAPYKYYMAKISGTPTINFICFDRPEGGRVYKGEGTLQFVAYYPYAKSRFKYLDEAVYEENGELKEYKNKEEWKVSSGMLDNDVELQNKTGKIIDFYNPGVKEADWIAVYEFPEGNETISSLSKVQISDGYNAGNYLEFNDIKKDKEDTHFRINSKIELIEGGTYTSNIFTPSGSLYNKYVKGGKFFKLPISESKDKIRKFESIPKAVVDSWTGCIQFDYDYIYY